MSCLHCQFWVIKHHIGSGSNPDLGPDVPSWLLTLLLHVDSFFFLSVESLLLLLTLANEKGYFSLPRLFND